MQGLEFGALGFRSWEFGVSAASVGMEAGGLIFSALKLMEANAQRGLSMAFVVPPFALGLCLGAYTLNLNPYSVYEHRSCAEQDSRAPQGRR